MNNSIKNEFNCPVEVTLHLIGGKWKPLILWHLSTKIMRFGELRKMIPGVTQKMLTQQLRDLEHDGLIIRKVYTEVPPKVEYCLSDLGKTFSPILEAMCNWGSEYLVSTDMAGTSKCFISQEEF